MNSLFIIFSVTVGLASFIMCFLDSRRYVLYSFCLLAVVSPIIWGYMEVSGSLAPVGGRLWSVLDIQLLLLVVIAYPLTRNSLTERRSSSVDFVIFVMTGLAILNFFVGYVRIGGLGNVLNITRQFMSLPVYFAAAWILARPENVRKFYKWIMWFSFFVFVLHIAIAFQLYYPPLAESSLIKAEVTYYRRLLRSSIYIYEPFYIVVAAVAICSIVYRKEGRLLAFLALGCSALGTLLTQARGMYGGAFLLVVGFFGLAKGKIKGMVFILAAGVLLLGVLQVTQSRGINLLYRFRAEGPGTIGEGYFQTVRGREFGNVLKAIAKVPQTVLTGQGFGIAFDELDASKSRSHLHNDYLGALYSLGLIGFVCYCFIMFTSIFRGRRYCRDPELAYLIMPARLIFFALAGYAFLNQTIWLYKGTALIMAMLAISRNSDLYAEQTCCMREFYSEQQLEYDDSPQLAV